VAWEVHIRKGWATRETHIAVMRDYSGEIVLQVPPSHITQHATVIDGGRKLHLGIPYHGMEQRHRVVTPRDPWMEVKYSRGEVI
jgi:hypothetical protein